MLSIVVDELPILDDVMLHTAPSVIVMVMALMVSAIMMHGSHCSHVFLQFRRNYCRVSEVSDHLEKTRFLLKLPGETFQDIGFLFRVCTLYTQ